MAPRECISQYYYFIKIKILQRLQHFLAEDEQFKTAQQQQQIEKQQFSNTAGLVPDIVQATTPTFNVARNRGDEEVTVVTARHNDVHQWDKHDGNGDDELFIKLP